MLQGRVRRRAQPAHDVRLAAGFAWFLARSSNCIDFATDGRVAGAVHVIFAVDDLARSVAFYEGVFDWPRNDRIDYREYVELCAPDGTLGLCERETYAYLTGATPMTPENGDVSPAYLYVRVPDVRGTIAKLDEAGARSLAPLALRSWGEEAAWFADRDGNVVAVAQASS